MNLEGVNKNYGEGIQHSTVDSYSLLQILDYTLLKTFDSRNKGELIFHDYRHKLVTNNLYLHYCSNLVIPQWCQWSKKLRLYVYQEKEDMPFRREILLSIYIEMCSFSFVCLDTAI